MSEERGEVPDAFVHEELGPIAFVYGDETMGLAHIKGKRGIEFVMRIPSVLKYGRVERDPKYPRAYVVDDADPANVAVIRLDWDGQAKVWLVTLYPDEQEKFVRQARTSNVPPEQTSTRIPDVTGQENFSTSEETGLDLSDDPNSPNYRYRDTGVIEGARKMNVTESFRAAVRQGQL